MASLETWIGSRDADFEVLLRMDYISLGIISLTNKLFFDICLDPYFWKEKMCYDKLDHLVQYKPTWMTQFSQYLSLVNDESWSYEKLVDEDRFDIFLLKRFQNESADYAAIRSRIMFLDHSSAAGILPSCEACFQAAARGHLQVTLWAEQKGIQIDTFGQRLFNKDRESIVNIAAEEGHLDVAKYFHQKYSVPLQVRGATRAAANGHIEVVKWFKEQGVTFSPFVDTSRIILSGNLEALKYLESNGVKFATSSANVAAINGNLEMLFWFESKGILANSDYAISGAALNGHIEVLELFAKRGIYPSADIIPSVLDKKDITILNFMGSIGIIPTVGMISDSLNFGSDVKTLKWILDNGLKPRQRYSNMLAMKGDVEGLNLLAAHDIYPNFSAINTLIMIGHINVLEWLYALGQLPKNLKLSEVDRINKKVLTWLFVHGHKPQQDEINTVFRSGKLDCIEFYASKGFFPSSDMIFRNKDLLIFETIIKHGYIMPKKYCQCIFFDDPNRHMSDWLMSNGIIPFLEDISQTMYVGNMSLVEWVIKREIYTPKEIMIEAMMTQNIRALNWLYDRCSQLDNELISFAIDNGLISVVEWITKVQPKYRILN